PSQNLNVYRARFKNSAGEAVSKEALLTVHYKPIVTKNPASVTVIEGENATFEAAANANPPPTVKWEVSVDGGTTWGQVKEATSTTLTITAAKTSQSGNEYRATFTNL